MSFFSKLMSKVYQSVVQDQFCHPISQHQIYSILHKSHQNNTISLNSLLKRTSSEPLPNIHDFLTSAPEEYNTELEFRKLGYEPNLDNISERLNKLKKMKNVVDQYLLEHSQEYIDKVNQSIAEMGDKKEFYSGRIKGQELRKVISRLRSVMDCGKKITRLNIRMNNIKNTLKVLTQIPNIKKMNLIQLKSLQKQSLLSLSTELSTLSQTNTSLVCLQNLYSYITKINNEQFIYIIDKLKTNMQSFQNSSYEEVVRNYIVIAPSTSLEKLMGSLLEQKIRAVFQGDSNSGSRGGVEEVGRMGQKVIAVITNMHKILKWHRVNRATKQLSNPKSRKNSVLSSHSQQLRNRNLSIDSVLSQQSKLTIQLTQIVIIDPFALKSTLSKTIDACLADLITDNLMGEDMPVTTFYQYVYMVSRVGEICYNFTGGVLQKLKKVIIDYSNQRQYNLYIKYSKELISSLEVQRNDWNRLPFHNNYKYKGLDKLMFRMDKINQNQEFKKIEASVQRLFEPKERDMSEVKRLLREEEEDSEECLWEICPVRVPAADKLDKGFQEWSPDQSYLSFVQGDAILCQSSFKLLSIFQKYFQLLMFLPKHEHYESYLSHLLILVEYYLYYLFTTFLTSAYKQIFYEPYNPQSQIQRKYTKRRLSYLYPSLTQFTNQFRKNVEQEGMGHQGKMMARFYACFRKDIAEIKGDTNQVLKAKVIATQSCKFVIAYYQEICKKLLPQTSPQLKNRIQRSKGVVVELATILLTESCQKMVGLQLQTMRSLFQNIRWYQPFEELTEYINKLAGLIRDSYQRLKSSNRGQIPLSLIYRIFILIWRTLLTYSIKLFLQSRPSSSKALQSKTSFQKYIDEMYLQFNNTANPQLSTLTSAYQIFKSIFPILFCGQQEECRSMLMMTMKKYDYIFGILMGIWDNCQFMLGVLGEKEKEKQRKMMREGIEELLDREEL